MIIPSSRSTSFCNFCTERSANSARASACDENNHGKSFSLNKNRINVCVCVCLVRVRVLGFDRACIRQAFF
jgi:hypothetical protein